MFVVRRGLVAFACVSLFLVGACGDDTPKGDGSSTPSPSASISSSSSPSESESVLPENQPASEVTPEEIVHAWFEAYNELSLTGEADRFRAMATPSCFTCNSLAEEISDVYNAGGSVLTEGQPNKIASIDSLDNPNSEVTRLSVSFAASRGTTTMSRGGEVIPFEARDDTWDFDLLVVDGFWRVDEVAG